MVPKSSDRLVRTTVTTYNGYTTAEGRRLYLEYMYMCVCFERNENILMKHLEGRCVPK